MSDFKNDCQRNKVFGLTLEKAVGITIGKSYENISLKKIFKDIVLPPTYIVRKKFILINKNNKNTVFHKYLPITLEHLEEGTITSRIIIKDKYLKVCYNPKCKMYGQTRFLKGINKCECKEKLEIYELRKEADEILIKGTKEELFNFLLDKTYINVTDRYLKKRLDNLIILPDGDIVVIETKNKTYTEVPGSDVISSFIYPMIIKEYKKTTNVDCKRLTIVKKGDEAEGLGNLVKSFSLLHELDFDFVIEDYITWCSEHKTEKGYLKSITPKWNEKLKKHEWFYEFSETFIGTVLNILPENLNPKVTDFKLKGGFNKKSKDDRISLAFMLIHSKNLLK